LEQLNAAALMSTQAEVAGKEESALHCSGFPPTGVASAKSFTSTVLAAYLGTIGCQDLDLFSLGVLTQQPQAQRSNHFCCMRISDRFSMFLFIFITVGPPENW